MNIDFLAIIKALSVVFEFWVGGYIILYLSRSLNPENLLFLKRSFSQVCVMDREWISVNTTSQYKATYPAKWPLLQNSHFQARLAAEQIDKKQKKKSSAGKFYVHNGQIMES